MDMERYNIANRLSCVKGHLETQLRDQQIPRPPSMMY